MLEHLTDAALLGLVAARREARRLGLDTVEVGPLFVGLLAAEGGAAGQALAEVIGPLDRLQAILGQPKEQAEDAHPDAAPLPLSHSARRVVTAAGDVGGPIGAGHILAALVAEDAIAGLLRAAGIDVGEVRDRVEALRGSAGPR
ncbi:MAG: Clp protease N-terminal domain-containing protein [Egibacteraceae bacterium]